MRIKVAEHNAQEMRLSGQMEAASFVIDDVSWQGDAALLPALEQALGGDGLDVTFAIANPSEVAAFVQDFSFRFTIADETTRCTCPAAARQGVWAIDGADSFFVCVGFDQGCPGAVLMPLFRAQFDDARELEAPQGMRAFRLAFRAGEKARENRKQEGTLFQAPQTCLRVEPGETLRLTVRLFAAASLDAARSSLRRNGMLAEIITSGINRAAAPKTDFFDMSPPYRAVHILADAICCAKVSEGRLVSLSHTGGSLEMIAQGAGFGDIEAVLADGQAVSTSVLATKELAPGHYRCGDERLAINRQFILEKGKLLFRFTLENKSGQPLHIEDLRMGFPMNSRMEEGVSAAQRVLRHSQVAQENSFFLFTPCDGTPPMLLCLPLPGTRFELFDSGENREYRAYLRAAGAERKARAAGCRWPQPVSDLVLSPGEKASFGVLMQFVSSYEHARDCIVAQGLCDVEILPGSTIARGQRALLHARCAHKDLAVVPQFSEDTEVRLLRHEGDVYLFALSFAHLGENTLTLSFGGMRGVVELFVTLPIREMIGLRGRFIAGHQVRDTHKWYDGLLAEWNNETGVLLTPDNPDRISGWRVYEFTCDDPGLSKPAFLASKNAEYPVEAEIEALEYYIERFVWGGLQRTDAEEFPYGLFGIPQWHSLRGMRNVNSTELAHLWRAYDYPHIALTYYMLYRIGKKDGALLKRQDKATYLERAYRTFLAMYTYPDETGHAFVGPDGIYGTGFYNELAIADTIEALLEEGRQEAAARLRNHWRKKSTYFVTQCQDLFRSECTFDTTGFETTQAVVNWARQWARRVEPTEGVVREGYGIDTVERFARQQTQSNIACRGNLESAYYMRGSDIRGNSNHYLLSYMSQMGGWSLMEEALYGPGDPYALLRLASASAQSSWALVNAGDAQSNYGYWFPGEMHNGAAGGGFEPVPTGYTWLEQPHHRGSWYYSCEIDLGFCGALRAANIVLAEDPDFGLFCYGGEVKTEENLLTILPQDGVQRRFHYLSGAERIHILVDGARLQKVELSDGLVRCFFEDASPKACLRAFTHSGRPIAPQGKAQANGGFCSINSDRMELRVQ